MSALASAGPASLVAALHYSRDRAALPNTPQTHPKPTSPPSPPNPHYRIPLSQDTLFDGGAVVQQLSERLVEGAVRMNIWVLSDANLAICRMTAQQLQHMRRRRRRRLWKCKNETGHSLPMKCQLNRCPYELLPLRTAAGQCGACAGARGVVRRTKEQRVNPCRQTNSCSHKLPAGQRSVRAGEGGAGVGRSRIQKPAKNSSLRMAFASICLQGSAAYAPEKEALVWKIRNFPGGKEFLLRAKFGLPSVAAEDEQVGRMPPIRVSYEIPYFTVSGIQVGT